MRSGDLRHSITFQNRDVATDDYGQQVTTWTTAFQARASIEALSARELLAAQAVQSEVSHKITVRYRTEFANPKAVSSMRVSFKGRLFNIAGSMNIDERNRTVELLAFEGVNNG